MCVPLYVSHAASWPHHGTPFAPRVKKTAAMSRRRRPSQEDGFMFNIDAAHLQMDHILTTLEEAASNADWTTTQQIHQEFAMSITVEVHTLGGSSHTRSMTRRILITFLHTLVPYLERGANLLADRHTVRKTDARRQRPCQEDGHVQRTVAVDFGHVKETVLFMKTTTVDFGHVKKTATMSRRLPCQ